MPPAPAQVAGASSKSDSPAVVSPRLQPSPVRDPAPSAQDEEAIARVNDQLRAVQEEELKQLAQRGIAQPQGMVVIPAGEFLMGAEDGLQDARPLHRVHLSSYWLDKYEVTNAQYRQCVEGGGCTPPKDRLTFEDLQRAQHPVTNITWNQARSYCQWQGKRLPTEAEWEKAARGTDGRRYPWGQKWEPSRSNTYEASMRGPTAVNTFNDVSPYEAHDMLGNAQEWTADWYKAYKGNTKKDQNF